MAEDKVNYAFVKGDPTVSPLLLLHGQGGDENDLLPIGKYLSPNSPMLSIRGRVQEQGMNRYFKHTENGGFDLNDLEQETTWLFSVLNDLCRKFDIDYERFIVIGYSNGANVAARALLTRSDTFHTGIQNKILAMSKSGCHMAIKIRLCQHKTSKCLIRTLKSKVPMSRFSVMGKVTI